MATQTTMMEESIEQIVVLRSHLEDWETVLRWAHGHFAALDLAENYRAGRPSLNKPSRLNMLTLRAHTRLRGYLNDELSQEESLFTDESL